MTSPISVSLSATVPGLTNPRDLNFSADGKRFFIIDQQADKIYYFTLNESWNLNSGINNINPYNLSIVSQEPLGSGLFINEYEKKIYFIGTQNITIYQYGFEYESFPLLQYSGSSSDNNLLLYITPSGSNLYMSGTDVQNTIKSLPNVNDGDWHLITLTSDLRTRIRRVRNTKVAINTTVGKIYVDGGLATQAVQLYKKLDISGLFLSSRDKVSLARNNYNLHDIMVWDRSLTEEEINKVFRISKSSFAQEPKKYLEHKLDDTKIPKPIHVYSARLEENTATLLDEAGSANVTLVNFTASVNLHPQNNGIISYSTYFNGPYQGANWKSLRNAEHPVTRKLTTENTNIISVVVPAGSRDVYRTKIINGNPIQIKYTLPASRKQGTILNAKESPVYVNNKPLKHRFILKDSPNKNIAFEISHTYGNNLQYFASKQLNDTLGLGKRDRQVNDTFLDYYDGTIDNSENPIEKFVGYTYGETIFPKPGQALLKDVRQRTDYITDEPGYGLDGYDRQLGTQRAFWRDEQQDRMRTVNSYINSVGNTFDSVYLNLPFQTPSMAPFEFITESIKVQSTIDYFGDLSIIDFNNKNSGELNSLNATSIVLNSFGSYNNYIFPSSQNLELYFFKNESFRQTFNCILGNAFDYPNVDRKDPCSIRISPKYVFEHPSRIASVIDPEEPDYLQNSIYNQFTYDLGMNRLTEIISEKNPWYDSYEDYYLDVKNLSNDWLNTYSAISEFKISDNIEDLISKYGGDANKIKLINYNSCFLSDIRGQLEKENDLFTEQNKINIIVSGVKKLLPYNGFYPQERSLQLVNYLKKSYLDTGAIKGGLILKDSLNQEIIYDETDKLIQQYKQAAFLEPLYSPGIFYNLIKSGIAVSWTMYTGSLPPGEIGPLNKLPDYTIDFESLIDLKQIPISSSAEGEKNRMLKIKELNYPWPSEDYSSTMSFASFQGFFERIKEGSVTYSLSVNNFLAETINFFLKDSKLNSFISKPDTEFSTFQSSKTYYMDIVLKKKDLVMCEAHSSSIANNFGKMSGRYFGPSFWTGSSDDFTRISNSYLLAETLRDPGYCMYTPPYYYGDSIARLSFKPDSNRKYSLEEIFAELNVEFINTSFIDNSVYSSGSLYSSFVMPLESSVKIKGQIEERQQTIDLSAVRNVTNNLRNSFSRAANVGTATNITGIKKWVISPKMEVPVLDFSNQDFISSSNILTQSYVDEQLKITNPYHTPPTASGFGRGMWSGYGEIPTGDSGIFIEIKESFPRSLLGSLDPVTRRFKETTTGSLIQACGFQQVNRELSKRIGEIADSKEISEAIIIIPYSDNKRTPEISAINEDHFLRVNDTINIEGNNFFKINEEIFDKQLSNILSGKSAVISGDFGLTGEIKETSISSMIEKMQKYIMPPNFDFLINRNIKPFVVYIAEFTSTLDKQDLADIWQGVMPKIAMTAEREQQVISHNNTLYDFFHGKGLPKNVKFMIFKAKKRAEINYYKMTADSTDDGLFPSIQAGKPPSPYSFNWPYDYFSLVETAKVDVQIEYISGSNNI
jgi:hypothetical protein